MVIIVMGVQELKAQLSQLMPTNNTTDLKSSGEERIEKTYHRADWQKVEIDFLNSYYSQDGNNSAVTGGIGTEQLTDFTQKISINIPTTPNFRLQLDGAYDYYSSASTDNIDNIRSSDSSSDIRVQAGVGFEYDMSKNLTTQMRVGASSEYDYVSIHAGGGLTLKNQSGNSALSAYGQAFYDTWIPYYPSELRGEVSVPTEKRQSYNLSLAYNQVMGKKVQASIMLESTYMKGLLSTPFHRVFFQEKDQVDIERLPNQRLKIPIGTRINYHVSERLILRSYYRYYYDNWGMTGHTASVELPVKLNRFFAIYPHYRYHTQSAVDHFLPYRQHTSTSNFYTSDFDLSDLSTQTFGMGIIYSRPQGIAKVSLPFIKNRSLSLESIDLKGSYYLRSTGLNAFIVSVGAKVSF